MTCTAASGTCNTCISACTRRPGWFMPGQVEVVADALGISLAELFRTRLIVDYWYADDRLSPTTFVLGPATVGGARPGTISSLNGQRGRCTFLTEDNRCEIHAVKPFECAQWFCGVREADLPMAHVDVARAWRDDPESQPQIAELLGREPELPPVSILDLLDITMSMIDDADPLGAHDETWNELRAAVREARDES